MESVIHPYSAGLYRQKWWCASIGIEALYDTRPRGLCNVSPWGLRTAEAVAPAARLSGRCVRGIASRPVTKGPPDSSEWMSR